MFSKFEGKKKQQEVYKNLVSFFFVIQWKYSKMVMPYMKMETLRQGQPPGRMFYFSICDKVTFPTYEVFNLSLEFAIEFKSLYLSISFG